MNTNNLKKFAQAARRKLLEQVGAKLELVLTTDSPELREKARQLSNLRKEMDKTGRAQLIEKVSYTWFNRLAALRFMDANDYQPSGIRVVSPANGTILPQSLNEAKQGNIPDDWKVDRKKVYDLLDGKLPASNPQNEAFRELLIAACNQLHTIFPFLFEAIDDYTELLLPDDLISQFSVVYEVVQGMTDEDCKEVEVLGWLYQFYISEEKDRLINAKKRYKAHEIAPVTQLFTPHWIVRYMVDNTLGQLWKETRPNTHLTDGLEFYIKPQNESLLPQRKHVTPEEITFFDPCCGSGHILTYAFDLFYKIYEEEGYNPSDIPALIITKNLFGADIDDRAAQLAGFALMMKGRHYQRRFLRKPVMPNIVAFRNIEQDPIFKNAKVLGSLIQVEQSYVDKIEVDSDSLFGETGLQLKRQAELLARKYDVVVTNPPYLNSSYMEKGIKEFVEKQYTETKADLFACILYRATELIKIDGFIGFLSPYVWMFLRSYEWLRKYIVKNALIDSLIQLEYNAFEPAVVPVGTFVIRNKKSEDERGTYIKLSKFKGAENQEPKVKEALKKKNVDYLFKVNQKKFENIDGCPLAYWADDLAYNLFKIENKVGDVADLKTGITTGDNLRFTRFWFEINYNSINIYSKDRQFKWVPLNCGGGFHKWYGNNDTVIFWENNGESIKNFSDPLTGVKKSTIRNEKYYFKESITWSKISNYRLSVRYSPNGFLFDAVGLSGFSKKIDIKYLQGLLNSNVADYFAKLLNESMSIIVGDLVKIPFIEKYSTDVINLTNDCISISKSDWDNRELSMEFKSISPNINISKNSLQAWINDYENYWKTAFENLYKHECDLNNIFKSIYNLDVISSHVNLKDITILVEELNISNGSLNFNRKNIVSQIISFAVGCMFGRYSLDKEGLILANQGETLTDFYSKLEHSPLESLSRSSGRGQRGVTFLPDEDNVIPVLDDEWFEDDIVGRFYEFLKVTFGKEHFDKNLAFVEDCLGKDIRKYFAKDFYNDHIRRYKKRPIYWMFSSPDGSFNVLIYMHRYTPDTLSIILNDYLREYQEKLKTRKEHLAHIEATGSPAEVSKAIKEKDKISKIQLELYEYERDILYPLATERIRIDLDDGVLVNYNKFGRAVKEVKGLNDKKTKEKVRGFDWIDGTTIK